MAVLKEPVNNDRPFADRIGNETAPAGTWMATVLDIKDEFAVTRPKYENPQELETVDLTTFLFGFRDQLGMPHYASSRSMKISGNEKSTLFGFLKAILGRAPQYGWDYCELKGRQCLLTIEHQARRDGAGVFAAIAALSPVPQGMGTVAGAATVTGPARTAVPVGMGRGAGAQAPVARQGAYPATAPVAAPAGFPSPAPQAAQAPATMVPAPAGAWGGGDDLPPF